MQAAGLMRTLRARDRPTRLPRALEELGRPVKTLYLRFIDDEGYRRRILVQINRHEARHQLARLVFHGKRSELSQRYRERREDQLGALGLVVNIIVLWNTIYMDAALNRLRAVGRRNWTLAGPDARGYRAAAIHALIETAKPHVSSPRHTSAASSSASPLTR